MFRDGFFEEVVKNRDIYYTGSGYAKVAAAGKENEETSENWFFGADFSGADWTNVMGRQLE